jgi:hypothetical protein
VHERVVAADIPARIETDPVMRLADAADGGLVDAVEIAVEDRLPMADLGVPGARHMLAILEEGRRLRILGHVLVETIEDARHLRQEELLVFTK